jgi:hypothetical protein
MAVDVTARSVGLVGWWALAAVAFTLALLGWTGRAGVPRAGAVMRAIVRTRFGRIALLAGWLVLGWHLFLSPPGG